MRAVSGAWGRERPGAAFFGMASPARPSLRWEQQRAADIIQLLSLYRPLLDSYIIDFFTEGLWAQLPPAWQRALGTATPQQLAKLLGCQGGPGEGGAWPLSLLAFVAATRALSCPRGGQLGPGAGGVGGSAPPCQSPLLHPLLRRHLKPKKQHEVQRLGKLLQLLSQATGCEQVVDVGAGQPSTGHPPPGYPLSASVAALPGHQLSYRAREGACHALEEYQERLAQGSCRLRAHCYRAALERLIREALPGCRRQAVPTARGAHERPFPEYASRSLARLGLAAGSAALAAEQVQAMLGQHHRVVAFFSLGLLLAPLVESLILLDRLLYLREQGLQCALVPLFEPRFSPRNLVLVAARTGLGTVLAELAQGTEEELGRAEPAEGGQRPPGAGQQPQ